MQKTHTVEYLAEKLRALRRLSGNTPLLGIRFRYRGMTRTIYAKSEQLNMTGSVKDRMALHVLRKAYEEGKIHPGCIIAEATSGNTGISFAAIGLMAWMELPAMIVFLGAAWNAENVALPQGILPCHQTIHE